jgi:hypothetical protein
MMSDQEQRERGLVLAEARPWIGTPFLHMSDVKQGAVDCAMWLVRIFVDCGIVEPFDPRWSGGVPGVGEKTGYPRLWFLHQERELYLEWLNRFAVEIPAEEAQPADIVIYKYGKCFSHSGLILNDRMLMHSWFKDGQVTECERFTIELTTYGRDAPRKMGQPRPVKYFNPWKNRQAA